MRDFITITDVVTRDGLQIEPKILSTDVKVAIIEKLIAAGVKRFEVASFVHPKYVPQMADAEEVFKRLGKRDGVIFTALTLNERGVDRAIQAGVDELNFVFSVSETHNRKNTRQSVESSIRNIQSLVKKAGDHQIPVNIALATSFGCPFEGLYEPDRVLVLIERLIDLGVTSFTLADTTGMANPKQVKEACEQVLQHWSDIKLQLHLHNTRGMGAANVIAGIQAGVTNFDSSLGGIGGCPFAPGATGNICTEDIVHMLDLMGYETGLDIDQLIATAKYLEKELGRTIPGQIMKAGKSTDLHPSDWEPAN